MKSFRNSFYFTRFKRGRRIYLSLNNRDFVWKILRLNIVKRNVAGKKFEDLMKSAEAAENLDFEISETDQCHVILNRTRIIS